MTNHLSVSIVVPCYNQAKSLPQTLASVFNQSYQNWECIIVNDGSPDNTAEIARLWVDKDVRFRYLEKSNGGLASARNAGIAAAKGKIILPLDSDDLIKPLFLEKCLCLFGTVPDLEVISTYVEFFGAYSGIWKPPGTSIDHFVHMNPIVCTSLFSKTLWVKLSGYDEDMRSGFEDWDFWLRAADSGVTFKVLPEPLFRYRRNNNSMIEGAFSKRADIVSYLLAKNSHIFQKNYIAAIQGREKEISELNYRLQAEKSKLTSSHPNGRYYVLGKLITAPIRMLKQFITKLFKHLF
jgi:glycosyltransferase involved in cell wall biosynthesis